MSSDTTSVRLAPDADMPRKVTPWVVGLATEEDVRRNRLNPGTTRNWSSSRTAGAVVMLERSIVVTLLSIDSLVDAASADTLICSVIRWGRSSVCERGRLREPDFTSAPGRTPGT